MDIKEIIASYPTKTAFCEMAGIRIQYLNQIERGSRPWPKKAVANIWRAHDIDPEALRQDFFEYFPVQTEHDNASA